MNKNPLVSIITPSFNQAEFLEETITSVITQDYPNIEYIVIDGASTDGSLEIIKRYASKIKYWVSEPDHGQAEAINKGFLKATGEIIAWINSDDYYLPGTISSVVSAFQKYEDCGLVYGDLLSVDKDGVIFNILRYGDWGLDELMRFNIIGQPSVFMKHEALKKAGYLEKDFHYMLDHNLWLKIASVSKIKYIPELWSAARYHEGAKNLLHAAAFGGEAYKVVEWMEQQDVISKKLMQDRNKIMGGAHWINARYLSEAGEYKKSVKSYYRCLLVDPIRILHDWKRVVFTWLSLFGIKKIQNIYSRYQYKRYNHLSK